MTVHLSATQLVACGAGLGFLPAAAFGWLASRVADWRAVRVWERRRPDDAA